MTNKNFKLTEWLGFETKKIASNKSIGGVIGAILFLSCIVIVPLTIIQFFIVLFDFSHSGGNHEAIRNIGLVVAAIVGVPFVAWRAIVAQAQVKVAEQAHITDRINKAVEGLGAEKIVKEVIETPRYRRNVDGTGWLYEDNQLVPALRPDGQPIVDRETFEHSKPNLEVRIGAIYALERIAQDSLRDHVQIMEILCAYIRENAPQNSLELTEDISERAVPRTDIQAAITVLGRRQNSQLILERENTFRLDLSRSDLSGMDLRRGDFSAAKFFDCRIEAALFDDANLEEVCLMVHS